MPTFLSTCIIDARSMAAAAIVQVAARSRPPSPLLFCVEWNVKPPLLLI